MKYVEKSNERQSIAGPVIQVQESDGLVALARKARRFFPLGSAEEIWRECRPLLADTNKPDAFLVSL